LEHRSWFDKPVLSTVEGLAMSGYGRPFALSLSKPVLSRPKGANLILSGALITPIF
jgi:hypothetical protein